MEAAGCHMQNFKLGDEVYFSQGDLITATALTPSMYWQMQAETTVFIIYAGCSAVPLVFITGGGSV